MTDNDSELYDRILNWLRKLKWHELRWLRCCLDVFRRGKHAAQSNNLSKADRDVWQDTADASLAGIKKLMQETKL